MSNTKINIRLDADGLKTTGSDRMPTPSSNDEINVQIKPKFVDYTHVGLMYNPHETFVRIGSTWPDKGPHGSPNHIFVSLS